MTAKKRGLRHVPSKIMDWNKHMKKFKKRLSWKTERTFEKKDRINHG